MRLCGSVSPTDTDLSFLFSKEGQYKRNPPPIVSNIRENWASIGDFSTPSKPTASKRRQQVQVNVTPVCRFHWQTKTAGSCQKPIGTDVCGSCPLGSSRLVNCDAEAVYQLHVWLFAASATWNLVTCRSSVCNCFNFFPFRLFFFLFFLLESTGAYRHFSVFAFSYWK